MEELKVLLKSLISINKSVYELLLDWINSNEDAGLRTTGVASRPLNLARAKLALNSVITQLQTISNNVDNIKGV